MRYHIVRGTLDAVGVKDPQQGRSSALDKKLREEASMEGENERERESGMEIEG